VYVASEGSNAVAVFSRNLSTGALTQLSSTNGCVSETGTSGAGADGPRCKSPTGVRVSPDGHSVVDGVALDGTFLPIVSPDNKDVYICSYDSDSISVLVRGR
jgi:DNA-binding beta-propeller fold protein YncE